MSVSRSVSTEGKSRAQSWTGIDKEVWNRFLAIAMPYFYPTENGGQGAWFSLLFATLCGVGGTSFVFWAAILQIVVSSTTEESRPERVTNIYSSITHVPSIIFAALSLFAWIGVFAYHSKALTGKFYRWAALFGCTWLLAGVVFVDVAITYVHRAINNQLHARSESGFYIVLSIYAGIYGFLIPIQAAYHASKMKLSRHWRNFLTRMLLTKYLQRQAYYRLDSNGCDFEIDNPDQRLTEDVKNFCEQLLSLMMFFLKHMLDLASFSVVLYAISPKLVLVLVVYAAIGVAISLCIGKKLINVNFKLLQTEADIRYGLIRVRENAEAIAFYGGEELEETGILVRLMNVLRTYDRLIIWETGMVTFQRVFDDLAKMVPYLAIGPIYLAGDTDLGTVTQGVVAFDHILKSLTVVMHQMEKISKFFAGVDRIGTFYDAMLKLEAEAGRDEQPKQLGKTKIGSSDEDLELAGFLESRSNTIKNETSEDGTLSFRGVSMATPTGRPLVQNLSLKLKASAQESPSRMLIVGPSGAGKSSVLRAIAGLWNYGKGEIERPDRGEMLFLPQKPYMPLGALRNQLLYPNLTSDVADESLTQILKKFGLGDLSERFDEGYDQVEEWSRVLSGGEQQRVAAARCLAAKPPPSLLVLDESTSALPMDTEAVVYNALAERGIPYISIGHRESLIEHHDSVLKLHGDGTWSFMTPEEYKKGV